MNDFDIRIPRSIYRCLHDHLFPGDGDEHGAVLEAGVRWDGERPTLLVRAVHFPEDGVDWVPGNRGYRMITARYVRGRIRRCRTQKLAYLAVHNHGGTDRVAFSTVDLETHERGFPALLDIGGGVPVGGLVFAQNAVAGDLWLEGRRRLTLRSMSIVGNSVETLHPEPQRPPSGADARFDRQVRIFGDRGQMMLQNMTVAIIGLGGVGMLVAFYLAKLGVGRFILIDPDRVSPSNLPRLPEATPFDAMTWLADERRPAWLRALGARLAVKKVKIAKRLIKKANPRAEILSFDTVFERVDVVRAVRAADYMFLAADSHRSRRLFNAIAHQYLIPGVQIGSRVRSDPETGEVVSAHTVTRHVFPDAGCLLCNGAISPARLQEESTTPDMLRRQRYIDDPDVVAPSVITMNADCVGRAVNAFLFQMTGLVDPTRSNAYIRVDPINARTRKILPRRDDSCGDCGSTDGSSLARGDGTPLPMIGWL